MTVPGDFVTAYSYRIAATPKSASSVNMRTGDAAIPVLKKFGEDRWRSSEAITKGAVPTTLKFDHGLLCDADVDSDGHWSGWFECRFDPRIIIYVSQTSGRGYAVGNQCAIPHPVSHAAATSHAGLAPTTSYQHQHLAFLPLELRQSSLLSFNRGNRSAHVATADLQFGADN